MIAAQNHTRMRAPDINKELVEKLSRIPQCDSDYLIPDGQELFNVADIGKELEALRNQMANNTTTAIKMPNSKPDDLSLPKLINFDTPQQTPGVLPETEPFDYTENGDAAEADTNNINENTIETSKNDNDKIITDAIDFKLNGNLKEMEIDTLSLTSLSSSATTETAPVTSSPDEATSKQINEINTTTTTNSETGPIVVSKDIAKLNNELPLNAMALNNGTIYASIQPTIPSSSLSKMPNECGEPIENFQNKDENSFCPPFTINGHGDAINNNDKFSKH